MSEGRIATELWVMAHLRQCSAQGIMATVVKRGDDWGGAVVIKLNLLGPGFRVLTQSRDIDGNTAWMQAKEGAILSEQDADEYIARAADPARSRSLGDRDRGPRRENPVRGQGDVREAFA
jgi:hypothetical protein